MIEPPPIGMTTTRTFQVWGRTKNAWGKRGLHIDWRDAERERVELQALPEIEEARIMIRVTTRSEDWYDRDVDSVRKGTHDD